MCSLNADIEKILVKWGFDAFLLANEVLYYISATANRRLCIGKTVPEVLK